MRKEGGRGLAMKFNWKNQVCLAVCLLVTMVGRAQSVKSDERSLWNVWCVGTNSAFEASEVVEACKGFKTASPKDPLTTVVFGFEAWHHLKRGNTGAAVKLFELMLVAREPATVIQKAGDKMARSWLTRIDREQVTRALKEIYVRDIEFPQSLEALKELKSAKAVPVTDRWGKPWAYRRASSIKGMESQRYVLESGQLGADSDLKKALKRPYADGLKLRAVRMVSGLTDTVELKTDNGMSLHRQLGREVNNGYLVFLGANIIVLSDGNHWSVLPKPR